MTETPVFDNIRCSSKENKKNNVLVSVPLCVLLHIKVYMEFAYLKKT